MRTGCRLIAVAGLALLFAADAAAGTVQLTSSFRGSVGFSAYAGHVVWSEFDPRSRHWTLQDWHAGRRSRLAVPGRSVPFDADVGSDARGRPTVVYSRCVIEPTLVPEGRDPSADWADARGCHLYELTLRPGARQRLIRRLFRPHASDTTPTIWRGRIAFSRRIWRGLKRGYPRILISTAHGLRRLPTGSVPRAGKRANARGARVAALDLGPSRLALLWWITGGNVFGLGTGWELWVDRLSGHHRTLIDGGTLSGTCGATLVRSPSMGRRRVTYLRLDTGCEPEDFAETRFISADPDSRHWRVFSPIDTTNWLAMDRGVVYWVRVADATSVTADFCVHQPARCTLMRSTGLAWKPLTARRAGPIVG